MSVREEDRNKNCPSRGLGLAAAAIGVGVGAALYYFFSKRPENPADEGSTTSGWEEQPHVLHEPYSNHDSSYTTVSEHSTTDTSIHDSFDNDQPNALRSISRRLWGSMSSVSPDSEISSESLSDDSIDTSESNSDSSSEYSVHSIDIPSLNTSNNDISLGSDLEMEWDVTNSSIDVPTDERTPNVMQFGELTVRLLNPQSGWNREREWTLEECSICFEGMLKDQEVFSLACTHRFHQACILPWLEQQQTCPNCRKAS